MGRIEHSMAARVPKKRTSSVATFPNLTLLGVIAKPVHQSSSFHRWEWVFSLLFFLGVVARIREVPFRRAENRLRLYYYTMAWAFFG